MIKRFLKVSVRRNFKPDAAVIEHVPRDAPGNEGVHAYWVQHYKVCFLFCLLHAGGEGGIAFGLKIGRSSCCFC